MNVKKDYIIAGFIGFFVALLALLIFTLLQSSLSNYALIIFGVPVIFAFGVWLGQFLGKQIAPFFIKFSKYAVVGFLSASIDFFVLNFLSLATGITAGIHIGLINIPGFLLATINAYLWNKFWVFSHDEKMHVDFPKFFAVTTLGLLLNSFILVLLVSHPFLSGVSSLLWLNISKIIAVAVAILWNYAGYSFFVFKTIK